MGNPASYSALIIIQRTIPGIKIPFCDILQIKKARDGIRTRGPHLGKVVLHP